MKRIIISEEQARKIVDFVINEQNETGGKNMTVNFGAIWPAGKWKLTANQLNSIKDELVKITNFIKENQGSVVTIQVEAGESQITNYDNEVTPSVELKPGNLSEKRGQSMVQYLTQYFDSLVKSGAIDKMPEIPQPLTKIGDTPYKKGDLIDPKTKKIDPEKYKKYEPEQFVRAIIGVKKDYDCIVGMEITIGYYPGQSKADHTCDEAIFELRMNGVSLGEVNLNNSTLDLVSAKIPKTSTRYENLQRRYEPLALRHGYENIDQYFEAISSINQSFTNYGRRTDGKSGGLRSQTFVLDGTKAKSIIDNSPSDKIVLSIVPLVSVDGKYKIFHAKGSHADTPWVTIKSRKSEQALFNAEPNIGMKRGSTKETVLLTTDLCGNPLTK